MIALLAAVGLLRAGGPHRNEWEQLPPPRERRAGSSECPSRGLSSQASLLETRASRLARVARLVSYACGDYDLRFERWLDVSPSIAITEARPWAKTYGHLGLKLSSRAALVVKRFWMAVRMHPRNHLSKRLRYRFKDGWRHRRPIRLVPQRKVQEEVRDHRDREHQHNKQQHKCWGNAGNTIIKSCGF